MNTCPAGLLPQPSCSPGSLGTMSRLHLLSWFLCLLSGCCNSGWRESVTNSNSNTKLAKLVNCWLFNFLQMPLMFPMCILIFFFYNICFIYAHTFFFFAAFGILVPWPHSLYGEVRVLNIGPPGESQCLYNFELGKLQPLFIKLLVSIEKGSEDPGFSAWAREQSQTLQRCLVERPTRAGRLHCILHCILP